MARKPKAAKTAPVVAPTEISSLPISERCNGAAPKASTSSELVKEDFATKIKRLWPDWDKPDGKDPTRPCRIFADGIFDMFHFGHSKCLEQAKKLFPYATLVVGVCSDADTIKYKGQTVFTEYERYESVRHCKWADEVIEGSPWVVTPEFLVEHQIDYVAHDALPYGDASGAGDGDDCYAWMKRSGRFQETQRTPGVSTSDIILRIVKNYNDYVFRNLARGYTRKELGVGLLKERQIRAKYQIKNLSRRVQEQQARIYGRGRKMKNRIEEQVQNSRSIYTRVQNRIAQQTSLQMTKWHHEIQDSAKWLHEVQTSAESYVQRMTGNVGKVFRSTLKPVNDEISKVNKFAHNKVVQVNKVVQDRFLQPLMKPRKSQSSSSFDASSSPETPIQTTA
mmetsp:Transcript_4071/g.6943  ORF Transcript_4071/g.6943 Transcript_4071/m.6943 type:complete len:393 (-) Transcript_4071:541-1719(-)|eukprot:CAMPEP_0198210954 /NCGR_PEP_ID=MMETSP1445-20131203/22536_1 /TAXON_ID=36898 /ORGANISM="Pyramimonas sp., Strain CCMP2087" /LENGTH=392 /DNA_ID=CAMNT_0043885123 /DNA_START=149 /DNA_END=1327 /DNA_ORIENTATION=+